jgi:hypothetical protein
MATAIHVFFGGHSILPLAGIRSQGLSYAATE